MVMVAPSSTVANCLMFQCADQFRWISRIAYRTAELGTTHSNLGCGRDERRRWEDDAVWQGFRELIEKLLVTWDWGEHFTALNLVVKPAVDEAFMRQLGGAARRNSDTLTAFLMDAQLLDSERSRRWSAALVNFMKEERTSTNAHHLLQWIDKWTPLADRAIDAFCKGLGEDAEASATEAKAATRQFRKGLAIAS
jgi:toluene monooxygenase system protein E